MTQFRQKVLAGDFSDIPEMVKSLVECGSQFTDPRSAEKVSFANSQSLVNQKRQFLINEQIRMIEYLLYE